MFFSTIPIYILYNPLYHPYRIPYINPFSLCLALGMTAGMVWLCVCSAHPSKKLPNYTLNPKHQSTSERPTSGALKTCSIVAGHCTVLLHRMLYKCPVLRNPRHWTFRPINLMHLRVPLPTNCCAKIPQSELSVRIERARPNVRDFSLGCLCRVQLEGCLASI